MKNILLKFCLWWWKNDRKVSFGALGVYVSVVFSLLANKYMFGGTYAWIAIPCFTLASLCATIIVGGCGKWFSKKFEIDGWRVVTRWETLWEDFPSGYVGVPENTPQLMHRNGRVWFLSQGIDQGWGIPVKQPFNVYKYPTANEWIIFEEEYGVSKPPEVMWKFFVDHGIR